MTTTTLSPTYRVVIPKEITKKIHLKGGRRMTVVTKGGVISFTPEKPRKTCKGFGKGMDTQDIREDGDRCCTSLILPAG